MLARTGGAIAALLGLSLLFYGGRLALAGGSPFYVLMALGLLASGIQLLRRRQNGLWIYALTLAASFVWTLFEVGFDKWQWIPRGALIAFLGVLLALPFVVNGLIDRPEKTWRPSAKSGPFALRATLAVIIVLGVVSWFVDPIVIKGDLEQVAEAGDPDVDPSGVAYPADDWVAYGGTNLGQRYSSLSDINTSNVADLEVAWEHHTGDLRVAAEDSGEYTFEATPLKVNGLLYFCTPHNIVQALDPETGELVWSFDPQMQRDPQYQHQMCRGVGYSDVTATQAPTDNDPDRSAAIEAAVAECPRRVVATSVDNRLFVMNADTGALCETFGEDGFVDLTDKQPNLQRTALMQTAAPLVAGNLVILGGSIADNYYNDNPSGVVRAYDVRTGELVWKFDSGNPYGDTAPLAEGEFYEPNSAVAWAQFSADESLGLVYVPFGNMSPDQVGLRRDEIDEMMNDSLVALDIKTGEMKWHFQTTHHDLWDRDNPSQPVLMNLPHDGEDVPALLLPTKIGNIFVLDRRTGEPIMPVTEVPVSTETNIPGEQLSPTQPVSALNFTAAPLTEADMWGTTPFDQIQCRLAYREARYDGNPWTPPEVGTAGSLVFPGNIGVFNWGSVAVDPVNHWMIATPQWISHHYKLFEREGDDLNASVFNSDAPAGESNPGNENLGGRYAVQIKKLFSALQVPCNAPPWGSRVGVDLTNGETAWKWRNGSVKGQKFLGVKFPFALEMGMLAHGGSLTTAGGLAFLGATLDDAIRAFDMKTGETLWKMPLPAGGQATPMTYRGEDGAQYIVIAAGGHGTLGTTMGDSVIAYKLPN
ncbi:membrane-bound PQQ-dependent dehydrogenase, glucose/quinate/shikimate family [Alloyangia pacifica]|uniref:Quinoprotein glucose dehydrogenase n=1 Tax=Alloyangia pacifica TaxID=311180 RepID=A0A1I6RN07_9RHOB|nr:membrane-bound PQQ-dependent dehydrogenase, glucose/quinate/shikimate family [Alloyangia pacifica]SDG53835.1 quinoprotein glucose dehydrogenase [Alloyangia pacifica]SFS66123.1 quinoprotein glucose dehydrogenase [Alloyangia pacifica]